MGLFTRRMVRELAGASDGDTLQELAHRHGSPMQAANLTDSMVGTTHDGVRAAPADDDAAGGRLLATRGAALDPARAHASSAVAPAQSRGTR